MKIKTVESDYDKVISLPRAEHKRPKKPSILFRTLTRVIGAGDLKDTSFTYEASDEFRALKEPYLIFMNHSSFIDLEIAARIFYPKPYTIVCTSDGFVGKEWLMRSLGCIPTQKFVSDLTLIRDMKYSLETLKTSVLMYPEASYTFDGCATPLPRKLGNLFKMLKVPVVMVRTYGAFARDPLYNCLQKRKVKVTASVSVLFSKEEIASSPVDELDRKLDEAFSFDSFAWQEENGIEIAESFRADGLERILYRCASCGTEGKMKGEGTSLVCSACGKVLTLDEHGKLISPDGAAENGEVRFSHIPDWYRWERSEVRREIEEGTYHLDVPVKIGMMVDYKAIYMVGDGRLVHTADGFVLDGCGGKLHYEQKPLASYGLYADYYWYELGDIVCIGNRDALYYCFPENVPVAKVRLAAEELFKLKR
ncbi:MAG: 1-acyl-sn-glycerol-3-phosphate acyltransferase [Lachnospiraceae bacterium]|nr:1-acyl-sn-glycerol-3-phosphate acyltransferase [Lachnospiraceae bacterium]